MRSIGERAKSLGFKAEGDFDTGQCCLAYADKHLPFRDMGEAHRFLDGYELAQQRHAEQVSA